MHQLVYAFVFSFTVRLETETISISALENVRFQLLVHFNFATVYKYGLSRLGKCC